MILSFIKIFNILFFPKKNYKIHIIILMQYKHKKDFSKENQYNIIINN